MKTTPLILLFVFLLIELVSSFPSSYKNNGSDLEEEIPKSLVQHYGIPAINAANQEEKLSGRLAQLP